ncbi:hypothetical protein GCM10027051_06700 [Niabella terrae]
MQGAITDIPASYEAIRLETERAAFPMASDKQTGSLLRTLTRSKKSARILELGTGTGLATSWILEGMDEGSRLTTIDNNPILLDIARQFLPDPRIDFILADAQTWLQQAGTQPFDLIFADAMPGKYEGLSETLALLQPGGLYIIDDMLPQPNWPAGHDQRVNQLISDLETRRDLAVTRLQWSTGILIAAKI